MNRKTRTFMCDFETTVYTGQVNTEVWASASVELFTEDVNIFHSIEEQFNYFIQQNKFRINSLILTAFAFAIHTSLFPLCSITPYAILCALNIK